MKNLLVATLLFVMGLSMGPCPAWAAPSAPIRHGARHAVQRIMRTFSDDAIRQFPRLGGRAGAQRIVDRVVQEGGDDAGRLLHRLAQRHGASVLDTIRHAPLPMTRALGNVSDDVARQAIRWSSNASDDALRMLARYGTDGIETVARHPAAGPRLLRQFGDDGAAHALRHLHPDDAIRLARQSNHISQMSGAQRRHLFQELGRTAIRTGGAVGSIYLVKDNILGKPERTVTHEDGSQVTEHPGLLDRTLQHGAEVAAPIIEVVGQTLRSIIWAGLIGLALFAAIKAKLIRRALFPLRRRNLKT